MQIQITKTVNLNKLHDELLDAELIAADAYFGADYFIAPEDADKTAIQTIIDNHDPTPRVLPPTELELLQEKVTMQDTVIEELMFVIIPEILGGVGGE